MQNFASSVELCAAEQHIDVTAALACADTPHGRDLFAQHGDRTREIQLTFVPSVAVDGVFDWDAQRQWLRSFEAMFCTAYEQKYAEPLAGCSDV